MWYTLRLVYMVLLKSDGVRIMWCARLNPVVACYGKIHADMSFINMYTYIHIIFNYYHLLMDIKELLNFERLLIESCTLIKIWMHHISVQNLSHRINDSYFTPVGESRINTQDIIPLYRSSHQKPLEIGCEYSDGFFLCPCRHFSSSLPGQPTLNQSLVGICYSTSY